MVFESGFMETQILTHRTPFKAVDSRQINSLVRLKIMFKTEGNMPNHLGRTQIEARHMDKVCCQPNRN